MRLSSGALGTLEIALNRFLAGDERALAQCADLAGRSLALRVQELDLELYLLPHGHGLEVADRFATEPDVRLSGRLRGFARTLFAGDNASLTGGELRIEGDVGLAQAFARLLQGVDLDLEDWLAQRIGDVPAHLAGRAARSVGAFARRAVNEFSLDAAEYLREETRDLVARAEVDEFSRTVDRLRADTDRLAARLRRLGR